MADESAAAPTTLSDVWQKVPPLRRACAFLQDTSNKHWSSLKAVAQTSKYLGKSMMDEVHGHCLVLNLKFPLSSSEPAILKQTVEEWQRLRGQKLRWLRIEFKGDQNFCFSTGYFYYLLLQHPRARQTCQAASHKFDPDSGQNQDIVSHPNIPFFSFSTF